MPPATLEPETHISVAGIIEECVAFQWNNLTLRGVLARPQESSKGLLVTVHGWATDRSGPGGLLFYLAREAASSGAAALRFDLPGRGESDGNYGETDIDTMIDATLAASAYAMGKTGLPGCFLAGICSGANVALAAAALSPEKTHGVLALSALPYQEHRGAAERLRRSLANMRKYLQKALHLSTWRRLLKGEVDIAGVGRAVSAKDAAERGGRNLKLSRHDIPAALARYKGRVTLIWGSSDPEAPGAEKYFRDILKNAPSPPEIMCLDAANHNFYGLHWHKQIAAAVRLLVMPPPAGRISASGGRKDEPQATGKP